jgi:hypothetical protein
MDSNNLKYVRLIGANFWNIRGSFTVLGGLLELGTQMSLVKLSSGLFVVIDTIAMTPEIKSEIDALTNNGELIESKYFSLAVEKMSNNKVFDR